MKQPDVVEMNQQQRDGLFERIRQSTLAEADQILIIKIIQFCFWLQFMLEESKLSIKRLKDLFGFTTPKKKKPSPSNSNKTDSAASEKNASPDESRTTASSTEVSDSKQPNESGTEKKKGHGRLGHEAYTGAETVYQAHPTLNHGDECPHALCTGRVYLEEAGTALKLVGNSTISAIRYIYERLKCNLCGAWFVAPLPEGVTLGKSYDASALAMMAINRYLNAVPAKRLEVTQQMVGVPLPDSTQFYKMEELLDYVYLPFVEMIKWGAQGEVIYNDDTRVKILSLIKENEGFGDKERRGMFTTGIVSKVGEKYIYLYFSGRAHAGENLDKVLKHRDKDRDKIIQMADALSASQTKMVETVLCICLSHGYRKFRDIDHRFPVKCGVVALVIGIIYKNDAFTKKEKLSDEKRLAYHKQHSAPLMEKLKAWLQRQIDKELVEPNGSLGGAIKYMLRHWTGLTRFLSVAGAPLDNNICEAALKLMIRIRKNSLFFKTEFGALVGSILVSVIYTTYINGENPKHYLITLQTYPTEVRRHPELWLPWNYRETLETLETSEPDLKKAS